MIDWILGLFGAVLRFFNTITGNYLVAILLFALFTKLILLPMSVKQQKNMIKQANLRPKEMAIRNKYKGRKDAPTQQKMNEEVMELYRKENYSPFGGCLPILIQFPLIIALYSVIRNPLRYITGMSKGLITEITTWITENGVNVLGLTEDVVNKVKTDAGLQLVSILRGEGNLDKIKAGVEGLADYTEKMLPNFKIFGLDLSVTPSISQLSWTWAIPVLTFVVYFFSMKLTRKFTYQPQTGPDGSDAANSMKTMDIVMPLISVWMTFMFPALLGIYWIFQSILGMVQQVIMSKVYPLPKFSEEDYKRAVKEMKNSHEFKSTVNYDPNKKYRSLHYIDDEDYIEKTAAEQKASGNAPAQNDNAGMLGEKPKLKEENPSHKKEK